MVYKFSDVWCLSDLASWMFAVGAYKACDGTSPAKLGRSAFILQRDKAWECGSWVWGLGVLGFRV